MVTATENRPCPDHRTTAHRRRRPGTVSRTPDACCRTGCRPGRSMTGQALTHSSPEPYTLRTYAASRAPCDKAMPLHAPDTRPLLSRAPRQRFARHPAGSAPRPFSFRPEGWRPTSGLRPGIIDKPPWPVTSRHRPVIAAPHILRQPQAVRPSLPPSKQEAWSCLNPPGSRPGTSARSPLLRSCLPGRQDAPGGKPTWTS